MKKLILIVLVLVVVGVGLGAYYMRRNGPEPQITTVQMSRGDIVDTVGATGTLEAVTTVEVGTQVSGVVEDLYADFNSIVRKGQIIAKLDPSLIQTQIEQNSANVIRAQADLDRFRVALADAQVKLNRAKELTARNLIPRTELETADVNVKSAEAQIRSSQAALTQARANLNQQTVNLQHTVIKAPIDGIVISRNVDPGQTVAASMSAPTLYVIAADLTQMQVLANIDEADVGRMRPGQTVRFRVDAYPTDEFIGSVQQVRLQPAVVQNVVTYSTVISVPNPELKLKPGMTANVNIEVARRNNVLRVPNAALRFRPTEAIFAALNQPVPPELQRGVGRGQAGASGGRGGATGAQQAPTAQSGSPSQPAATGAAAAASATPQRAPQTGGAAATPQAGSAQGTQRQPSADSAEARGGGDNTSGGRGVGGGRGFDPNMTPEERRKRMEERMASMTPEQREQMMARMREREARGGDGSSARADGGGRGQPATPNAAPNAAGGRRDPNRGLVQGVSAGSSIASGATTIDSLFGPLPVTESRGRIWLYLAATKQLKPVSLRLGISDGTYTEVLDGELQPGQEIVSNVLTGLEPAQRPGQQGAGQSQNPLIPQRGMPGGAGRGR
jgi:HlyD family secretion protein